MTATSPTSTRSSVWIANLLVALAISLIVNFSYLLLLIVEQRSDSETEEKRTLVMPQEGRLSITPDGYGYIIYPSLNGSTVDSVYVPAPRIHRLRLQDGDRLIVDLVAPRCDKAHYVIGKIKQRNGFPPGEPDRQAPVNVAFCRRGKYGFFHCGKQDARNFAESS